MKSKKCYIILSKTDKKLLSDLFTFFYDYKEPKDSDSLNKTIKKNISWIILFCKFFTDYEKDIKSLSQKLNSAHYEFNSIKIKKAKKNKKLN